MVPGSSSDTVLRLVSSDDITEVRLANSYHVATLDHDANLIVETSLQFIERVAAAHTA